jgi:DNA-binding NarL/FixJ family response regulator
MAIQPTPPGAPVFLVRTRVQPLQPITRRQMAVIAMLSEGWVYKQIATFLGISMRTVRGTRRPRHDAFPAIARPSNA